MNRWRNFLIALLFFISGCTSNDVNKSNYKDDILYLDYAASAPIDTHSLNAFIATSYMSGNSSGINLHAKKLKKLEKHATRIIAEKIKASHSQIHFINNASVANNIAVLGVAYKNPGCHLITSKIEHKRVLNIFRYLETQGYKVTYLDTDKYGNIDMCQLCRSIRRNTKLISIARLALYRI